MAADRPRRRPLTPTTDRRRDPRVSVGLVVDAGDARPLPDPPPPPARPGVAVAVALTADPVPRVAAEPPRDRVAARAHEIWVRNGRPAGTADRDWFQAEAELRAGPAAEPQGPAGRDEARVLGPVSVSAGAGPPAAKRGTIRLSGNVRYVTRTEWIGAPAVDAAGHIERSVDLPEDVYDRLERAIARGSIEGIVLLDGQRRVEWFLDR